MAELYGLIMAGGQGTRFWPESRKEKPKQYLNLLGETSLLEQTLDRFEGIIDVDHRYIVTVREQGELVAQNTNQKASLENVIYEPSGRNTAPCILLSLASLVNQGAKMEDIVAIVPSDHVILNQNGFRKTILKAKELASSNKCIVTIGIKPNFPHTGYGYIQKGASVEELSFHVQQFKEKPNVETAKEYLATGEYFWNAGMFVAPIGTLLEELSIHSPETYEHYDNLKENLANPDSVYSEIPKNSIDYAVMEKSKKVLVTEAQFDWNDLGSWDALESVIQPTEENILVKSEGHYFDNAKGNIVFTPGKFVGLINVNDLIIVSNEKAVVVLPKKDSQKVKDIVQSLEKK